MVRKLLIVLLLCFLLIGCTAGETAVPDTAEVEQVAEVATAVPTPSPTELPATPVPPSPTATAMEVIPTDSPPTATPVPLETATPRPTRELILIKRHTYVLYNDTNVEYWGSEPSSHFLDIYLPQIEGPAPPTLLVLPWLDEHPKELATTAEYFAYQGYNVVVPQLVVPSVSGRFYPTQEQNVFCALAWVYANADTYGFDTQRIVPIGFSLGGTHAALIGTVDEPEMFRGDCPHELPEGDLVSAVISVAGFFDYSYFQPGDIVDFVDYFSTDPNARIHASPINWVDGSEPPFLLLHGESDDIIDKSQSEMFANLLTEAGVPVQLEIKPGGHDLGYLNTTSATVVLPIKNFLEELFAE